LEDKRFMRTIDTAITLLSPAFLGDAEQNGQWRTPPIKALLRQWWRVVYAAKWNFSVDIAKMRHEEGMLFGHAWLADDCYERNGHSFSTAGRRSSVRIRLGHWHGGTLQKESWQSLDAVQHPEVGQQISADLYMGFGPVITPKSKGGPSSSRGASRTELKAHAALQAGEKAGLSLAFPEDATPEMEAVLGLWDRYAAFGGRSRNGWGSLSLPSASSQPSVNCFRPWRECLSENWPHAIGRDEKGPLVWETAACPDWKTAMVQLAKIKIALRTHFPIAGKGNGPQPRHWLAYPVTHHNVGGWEKLRLPNMLRFRIRAKADGQRAGAMYLMPYLPPKGFTPQRQNLESIWSEAIDYLDHTISLQRVSA
jgi:CRISPR-associated protein Cmr1